MSVPSGLFELHRVRYSNLSVFHFCLSISYARQGSADHLALSLLLSLLSASLLRSTNCLAAHPIHPSPPHTPKPQPRLIGHHIPPNPRRNLSVPKHTKKKDKKIIPLLLWSRYLGTCLIYSAYLQHLAPSAEAAKPPSLSVERRQGRAGQDSLVVVVDRLVACTVTLRHCCFLLALLPLLAEHHFFFFFFFLRADRASTPSPSPPPSYIPSLPLPPPPTILSSRKAPCRLRLLRRLDPLAKLNSRFGWLVGFDRIRNLDLGVIYIYSLLNWRELISY